MQQWLHDHPLVSYLIILVLSVYIFNNVFRAGRMPFLKEVFLYIFMAAGAWLLWILQHDRLPIVPILGGAAVAVLLVQIRRRMAAGNRGAGVPGEKRDGGDAEGAKNEGGAVKPEDEALAANGEETGKTANPETDRA
jgi:hypothetical protein